MFKNIVWIAAEKNRTEDNSVLPLWKQRHNVVTAPESTENILFVSADRIL